MLDACGIFGCVANGFVCQCMCLGASENQQFSTLTKHEKHKFQKKNGVMPSNSYLENKLLFNKNFFATLKGKPAAGMAKLLKKGVFSHKTKFFFYAACMFVLVL